MAAVHIKLAPPGSAPIPSVSTLFAALRELKDEQTESLATAPVKVRTAALRPMSTQQVLIIHDTSALNALAECYRYAPMSLRIPFGAEKYLSSSLRTSRMMMSSSSSILAAVGVIISKYPMSGRMVWGTFMGMAYSSVRSTQ